MSPLKVLAVDPHYHQLKILLDSQCLHVYAVVKDKVAEVLPQSKESVDTAGTTDLEAVSKKGKCNGIHAYRQFRTLKAIRERN